MYIYTYVFMIESGRNEYAMQADKTAFGRDFYGETAKKMASEVCGLLN